jgi:acetolactate synthase-1/2/3 large subunit
MRWMKDGNLRRPAKEKTTLKQMNGGSAILQSLLLHGVDTIFGMPGVQTYPFFDALYQAGDQVRLITPRHEQGAAYMAYGYAKSTGKVGVYAVVPGPGVLNTGAALCTAYGASTPVVCITGQVPTEFIGSGKGHVHELPDQLATLRTLTKWASRINHPAEAPRLVAAAFQQATSGRPRPVALEMAWDTCLAQAGVELVPPLAKYPTIPTDPDEISKAAKLLKDAKSPMIMVGGGAVNAGEEVLALAEFLQAPVVSYRAGRGIVSDEHYLGFTCASGFKRWEDTDVLIGIGSRLQLQWFEWGPQRCRKEKLVNIDIDPQQTGRLLPDVAVVGDARVSAHDLLAELQRISSPRASRREEFEAVKQSTWLEIQHVRPQIQYLEAIRRVLPRDGFFVEEVCQVGFTSYYGFPVYEPRKYVTGGHQGNLGFGFPTALGVKVANPDKAVVSIAGDGGFQFGLQELATAVQYGINLVVVVFNNNSYGNVMRDQKDHFGGRIIGSALRNPDFVALARSYGVNATKADTPDKLASALEKALAEQAPALIEVPIPTGTEYTPWELLKPAKKVRLQQ